jgi:hypothetical protein
VLNALFFSVLSILAQQTGSFHLRVICEAFAACYLVLLTFWAWFSSRNVWQRIPVATAAVVFVVWACRFVLADGFSPWFEVAMWYVPVTSVLAGGLRLAGFRIDSHHTTKTQPTFTIRSMMVVTAIVAVLFPLTGALVRSRAGGHLDSILWITDALIFVAPASMISIAITWAVLTNKLFHAGAFLLAAPISGVLICQIWNWDYYQSTVLLTTTAAAVTAVLTSLVRTIGFRLVCHRR